MIDLYRRFWAFLVTAAVVFGLVIQGCSPSGGRPRSALAPTDGSDGFNFPDAGTADGQIADTGGGDGQLGDTLGSGDLPGTGDPPDSGTPGPDNGPVVPDTKPSDPGTPVIPDSGGTGGDEGIIPGGSVSGGILIVEVDSSEYEVGSVAAHFIDGKTPEAAPIAKYGACSVLPGQPAPAAPVAGLDSGVITVSGLISPVTLSATSQGPMGYVYTSGLPETNKNILSGPTVAVVAAGGKHLPAWTVSAPTPKIVSVSQPSGGVFDSVDGDKALTITWNPANGTSINIHLFVVDTSGKQKSGNTVNCTLQGDSGSFVVPKNAMASLPKGGGFIPSDFLVFAVSRVVTAETTLGQIPGSVTLGIVRTSASAIGLK